MANDVHLLGAGFSHAIDKRMPLMPDPTKHVTERLSHLRRPLTESAAFFSDDFETMLSYLAEDQPWLSLAENLRNKAAFFDVPRLSRRSCQSLKSQPAPACRRHG